MGDITRNIAISLVVRSFEHTHSESTFRCSTVPTFSQFHNTQCHLTSHNLLGIVLTFLRWAFVLDHKVFVLDQWVFVLDHRVFVLDHRVFVLDQWVFVLDDRVFVLDQWVFVLDQWVFVLDHGIFVLDHRGLRFRSQVSVLDQWVLGDRSSFLGLRFRNTRLDRTRRIMGAECIVR